MKRRLLVVLRRTAQAIAVSLNFIRRALLFPFLVAGLILQPVVFQREYYRNSRKASYLRRRFPLLEFALIGAWELRNPHPGFQQERLAREYPDLLLHPPVLNHVLNPNADHDLPLAPLDTFWATPVAAPQAVGVLPEPTAAELVPQPVATQPAPAVVAPVASLVPAPKPVTAMPPADLLEEVWPLIEEDAVELSRGVSSLTPTQHVKRSLKANIRNTDFDPAEARVVVQLMDRLHDQVDHLFIVPWLGIRGGAERLSERYLSVLRARYRQDRIAILVPDAIHSHSVGTESRYGVPIVAINDVAPNLSPAARLRVLDRILINLRPASVHNASSLIGWQAFLAFGDRYIKDMNIFVTIFSDIRINDAEPVGYYHNYLPYLIDGVSGVLCDNRRIMEAAIEEFKFTPDQARKFYHVPTPILGLNGGDPRRDLRPYSTPRPKRSLWMSRIAMEKRLDVLNAIARALPRREITVYGATLAASVKVDLAWLDLPNIDYRGEFEKLNQLPVEEFDSYIFTTMCEGMPLSVLEATMLGLPVIAPDVGGIRELIDSETGWLVSSPTAVDEYVDALMQIESDPDEAARRVARAQERLADVHSLRRFISALEAVPGYMEETAR